MVKVSFHSALVRKDVTKDAQILLPEDEKDAEVAVAIGPRSRAWWWCLCLGLAMLLSGLVIGGVYLHHFSIPAGGQVFFCGVKYQEEHFMVRNIQEVAEKPEPWSDGPPAVVPQEDLEMYERIEILEKEQVELIDIPVPKFGDSHPAHIVHDFSRRLTAFYDVSLNNCYITSLNTSVIMPPKDLEELLNNMKSGHYLPQTYLVHEEMVVTERLRRVDQLGHHIHRLCGNKDTFKLQRRDHILGMQKREALNCHSIHHFESDVIVETQICEL